MSSRIDNASVTISIESDVLTFEVKNVPQTLEVVRSNMELARQLRESRPVRYCLVDFTELHHPLEKDAREYCVKPGGLQFEAVAMVGASSIARLIGNLLLRFIQLSKVKTPTKMFSSQHEARVWLGSLRMNRAS